MSTKPYEGHSPAVEKFLQDREPVGNETMEATDRPRNQVLRTAAQLISYDREEQYGDPHLHFEEVARMWRLLTGLDINTEMVPLMMAGLKMIRMKDSPDHADNAIDLTGYTALLHEIALQRRPQVTKPVEVSHG